MDFWESYRSVASKLRKRFMRKPNVADASDKFAQLVAATKRQGNHQYAAFCCLAVARCEQAMANTDSEAEKTVEAAQLFLQAEIENHNLNYAGFEEHLSEATQCYLLAIDLYSHLNRPLFAASLYMELATAMKLFNRIDDAALYFEKAAKLQLLSPLAALSSFEEAVACKIIKKDYDSAVATLSEMIDFALERFGVASGPGTVICPIGAALDFVSRAEITRLLLLLLLQPSPHASKPDHVAALQKFSSSETDAAGYIPSELLLLLQSLVLTCQSGDTAGAELLQGDLWTFLTPLQNDVLHLIVEELGKGFLTKT